MADSAQSRIIKQKICILGAAGVGKTSLVRRFVKSMFDDKYLSTVGVKIDKKSIQLENAEVVLNIWDVAGEEEFFQIPKSYYSGAAGYLLVIDGTRPETLATGLEIKARVTETAGEFPWIALLNKADLTEAWKLDDTALDSLAGIRTWKTSALDGLNVEVAFASLAERLVS
ncbi:MAG: Rab family GTPase [Limisphaerales bacterium]